jgi:hypothetical protein
MFPALFLGIIPATGGEQMPMGMVLPMAPMGVEHGDEATPERLAPDRAREIIEALRPTPHACVQYHLGVVVKVVRNIAGTVRIMCRESTPSCRALLTWLTQWSTETLAHRKHNDDLQRIATRCLPWPPCRQRYAIEPLFSGLPHASILATRLS